MEQHGFTNGESNAAWDKKTLKKDHEYSVTFQFIYFEELNEILYIAFYDGKDSTAGTDALQTQESRAENATNRVLTRYLMGAIETAQDSQPRNVYDEFHDVISDTNYYTQINDINSSDAQRVEETISKVLSIITNIGMVVSVIIPAVIGVKYMIVMNRKPFKFRVVLSLQIILKRWNILKLIMVICSVKLKYS